MLPHHKSRRPAPSAGAMAYLPYGLGAIFTLAVLKFLFFFDPIPLEDMLPFVNKTMYKVSTLHGDFVLELFPDAAPRTVAHFEKLVAAGYYTKDAGFYRAEPDFLVQAGGFVHDKVSPFGTVDVEYNLPSEERTVVLARSTDPSSGSTEFSIMLTDNTAINAPSADSPGYTVFGRVHAGYPNVKLLSEVMSEGYLAKKNRHQAIAFDAIETITALVPTTPELRLVSDAIHDALATRFSVVMFGKTTCPYCKKAKGILKELKAEVHVVEIDLLPPAVMSQYQDMLEALTGRRTVPNILLNGQSIGGGDDVEALHQSKKLAPMLHKIGALAKSVVLDSITKNPLVVFTKSFDPYSKDVKKLFKSLGANAVVIEIDTRDDGNAILFNLQKLTGRKTTPNVFVAGKTIGGCDDTKALHETGELTLLLQQAGAL
ncbi:hypothetical protein SDRG_15274 [Saprolegnia diclina VS20]|uniref:PPIase cyclophilin-type domain-containing protein n=1 Tax=Saprolegnia diclina (strain VS20) TaxID=1156394 RepID=T0R4G3_SAPDV|nr:hypothetical protein SDRG_15274 [Saprolegnia diclina VS20]EQC26943.1 hypothetical protein SDRG_15274 [Saprolegnia diclina VS20]|eukprot:XP_008619664.1 hypothetical protein SDRG_15274 [Saprolegnia diclina VS20]